MGVIAGALRWIVCGFSGDLVWIHVSSILHGVTVAGLVVGGPLYVESVVPERLRSTGQGMLAMIGFSLGGILSNVTCGWLFEHLGPRVPYMLGGVGGLVLGLLVPLLLPSPERPESKTE
jgi:PPP family 3-phenylpropionic acid transporter